MRRLINPPVVSVVLILLILLDLVYVAIIAISPATWFDVVYGAPYVDPEGLLRRTAAVWASFALFQTIALLRWRRQPHWLMFVAGIRSAEVVADWVHVAFAGDLTLGGRVGLLAASPINLLCTWFFFQAYLQLGPVTDRER